jgi:hemerythrin superfamily protein
LQAPHIKHADEKAFCQYMRHWCQFLHIHHSGEEDTLFPEIEALAGEKGLMDANVEQHYAFHGGLHEFFEYVEACCAGSEKYSGQKVVEMIDSFGKPLMEHLADEIPTLAGLRKFGKRMETLPKLMQAEGEKNMVCFCEYHYRVSSC